MESRHIRIDHGDAIESKRQVLNSELHLIQMLRKVKSFRHYRKKELELKTEFKTAVSYVKNKMNELITAMPELKEIKQDKKIVAAKSSSTGKKVVNTLQTELEDIKRRLQALQ